jgi:uncharacterized membrane protein YbhN (UPF0104 family)
MPGPVDNAAAQRYPGMGWIAIRRLGWINPRRSRFVSWVVSGACAIGFLLWARGQPMPRLPSGPAQSAALAVGVFAYGLATIGSCERWSSLLRTAVPGSSRIVSYRPVAVGQLGNVFLPARAGDAIRVGLAAASDERVSTQTAVGVLIAERALDIACHASLLTVVLAGVAASHMSLFTAVLVGVAGLAGLTLIVGVAVAVRGSARSLLARLLGERQVPAFLDTLLAPLLGLRRKGRRAILLSVAMWASEVTGWWAASHAVGLNLTGPQAAYVFAIASLAMVMPVGFGSIGTLDAGIIFALETIGLGTARVLSFVVLLRVLLVLPSAALFVGTVRGPRSRRC